MGVAIAITALLIVVIVLMIAVAMQDISIRKLGRRVGHLRSDLNSTERHLSQTFSCVANLNNRLNPIEMKFLANEEDVKATSQKQEKVEGYAVLPLNAAIDSRPSTID